MPKELLKAIMGALGEASGSVELNNFEELAEQEQSEARQTKEKIYG